MVNSILHNRQLAVKGKFGDPQMCEGAEVVVNAIEYSCGRLHVTGIDNLAGQKDPVVIAGNHMSTLETLILPAIIYPHKKYSFVVKKELVEGRIFGPIMRQLQPIAVGRENPREDLKAVLGEGAKLLQNGRSVCIFPQTTRRADFDPATFNSLAEKVAKRGGVKLIPLALKTDFWVPGRILRDFGRIYPERDVHVAFGPAVDCSLKGRDTHAEIVKFIGGKLESWGVECQA